MSSNEAASTSKNDDNKREDRPLTPVSTPNRATGEENDGRDAALTLQEALETLGDNEEDRDTLLDRLSQFFKKTVNINKDKPDIDQVLSEPSIEAVVEYIKSGKCKNIVAMVGAGISTSAGIPDFRSPSTGLYANMQKYDLPSPECMFHIGYFKTNPQPFFSLAKELYPGKFTPTPSHYFLKLLQDKGVLRRVYTQNIDMLERVAGIQDEKIVEAHGSFHKSHCISSSCRKEYSLEWIKVKIFADEIPRCESCDSLVKPDIVFFGENLPARFFDLSADDFDRCDLLIVMGTSLTVQPFASLVDNVLERTPRLVINMTKVGKSSKFAKLFGFGRGFQFDSDDNYRDVMWQGKTDEKCIEFANKLGWGDELKSLIDTVNKEQI